MKIIIILFKNWLFNVRKERAIKQVNKNADYFREMALFTAMLNKPLCPAVLGWLRSFCYGTTQNAGCCVS